MEPVGESRPNADVFGELLQRLELNAEGDPAGELEEMLDVLSQLPEPAGGEVRESGSATPPFDGRPIQFVDVFPRTPDQKVDLCPDGARKRGARRALRLSARPGDGGISAHADLARERTIDYVDARGAAAA